MLIILFWQEFKDKKTRTDRWISSSVPESDWNSPTAQFASAEYFGHNMVSPVLFQEAVEVFSLIQLVSISLMRIISETYN